MTEDAIGIIASNLTVAYFSAYERKPRAEPKSNETFGQFEGKKTLERDEVLQTYSKFKQALEESFRSI